MNPYALPFYPSGTPDCADPDPRFLHGSDSLSESSTYPASSPPFPGSPNGIGDHLSQLDNDNAQFALLTPRDLNKNSLQAFRQVSPRSPSHQATMNYVDSAFTTRSPQERTSATATPLRQQNHQDQETFLPFHDINPPATSANPWGRSRAAPLGPFNLVPNHPSLAPVFASLSQHWAQLPPTLVTSDEFTDGLIRFVSSYAVDPEDYEDLRARNSREQVLQGLHANHIGAWHSCLKRLRSSNGRVPRQSNLPRRHAFAYTAIAQGPDHSGPPETTFVAPEGLEESGQEDSTSKLEFRSPTLDPASLEVQTVTPDDSPMFLKKKPPESDPNLKKDEEIKKKLPPHSQENYFTSPSKDEENFPVNFHEEENQNCMKNVQENK
jgi:hypothetical protein